MSSACLDCVKIEDYIFCCYLGFLETLLKGKTKFMSQMRNLLSLLQPVSALLIVLSD